jgi:hypothetical protein
MINWEEVHVGSDLGLSLTETDGTQHNIVVTLKEYEWLPTRVPYIADLEVVAVNSDRLHIGNVIRLPLLTHNEEDFLVFAPYDMHPNNQFIMKAKILINNLN